MSDSQAERIQHLEDRFGEKLTAVAEDRGEITAEVTPQNWLEVARTLRDGEDFAFEQLIDLCGVDYLHFGQDEWATNSATGQGFGRGVHPGASARFTWSDSPPVEESDPRRFAVVVHLLSVSHNRRLRMRCFAPREELPVVPSLVDVWPVANWFEREAFDLFGIVFEGHPDLRRILTDYGFIGHPFRKDFPLLGNVEVRYDPERARVVYQPVSVEPRVLVPKVIRDDARYQGREITDKEVEQIKEANK